MSLLNQPVLVLNKMWMAINVVPAIKAFSYLFADKATVVNPEDYAVYNWEQWLKYPIKDGDVIAHTGHYGVIIPDVVVLLRYDKAFRKEFTCTKRNIYIRDGFRCQYTGKKGNHSNMNIDHIVPLNKGGRSTWENMVVCDKKINSKKADKTLKETGLKLIRKPKKLESNSIVIHPKMTIKESWKKFIKQKTMSITSTIKVEACNYRQDDDATIG